MKSLLVIIMIRIISCSLLATDVKNRSVVVNINSYNIENEIKKNSYDFKAFYNMYDLTSTFEKRLKAKFNRSIKYFYPLDPIFLYLYKKTKLVLILEMVSYFYDISMLYQYGYINVNNKQFITDKEIDDISIGIELISGKFYFDKNMVLTRFEDINSDFDIRFFYFIEDKHFFLKKIIFQRGNHFICMVLDYI